MTQRINATALDDPEAWLARQLEDIVDTVAKTEGDRRVWLATLASARVGLAQLARQPLEIEVAWPSGMNKLQRQTMQAQLQHELRRASLRRLAEELRVLLTLAPGIAVGLLEIAQQLPDDGEMPIGSGAPARRSSGLLERIRAILAR